MGGNELLFEQREHIGYLTLNRPEKRNALTLEIINELIWLLREAKENQALRVLVIKGAGDKAFCAGADLNELHERINTGVIAVREFTSKYAELTLAVAEAGKPVIAAVNGLAMAGGFGLAMACDLTIAAEEAEFGAPEINIGFWAGIIAVPIVRLIGVKRAAELLYTGRRIKAREAEQWGLINRAVAKEALAPEVDKLATAIASLSPVAMKLGRESLQLISDLEYAAAIKHAREVVTVLANSHDTQEGIKSFLEKRPPQWKGY